MHFTPHSLVYFYFYSFLSTFHHCKLTNSSLNLLSLRFHLTVLSIIGSFVQRFSSNLTPYLLYLHFTKYIKVDVPPFHTIFLFYFYLSLHSCFISTIFLSFTPLPYSYLIFLSYFPSLSFLWLIHHELSSSIRGKKGQGKNSVARTSSSWPSSSSPPPFFVPSFPSSLLLSLRPFL